RQDGKFMTSDCPVAKKHRHQMIGVVAAAVCLVALVSGFLMMMPPPPPPSKNASTDSDTEQTVVLSSPKSKSTSRLRSRKSMGSSYHYQAGDPVPEAQEAPKDDDTPAPAQKNYSDSEEKGDFWQFPNGDSAGHYKPGQ